MYGALLNQGCRFFDPRIGQSTTLTGRTIAKHMDSFTNECITGEYNHVGDAVIYGDSVTGNSMIELGDGTQTSIEDLFDSIAYKVVQDGGKEYAIPKDSDIKVLGFDAYEDEPVYGRINYVMRHKTSKQLFKVTTEDGSSVTVTEDHSLIIDRDGLTLDVRPMDLLEDDLIISINETRQKVVKIEKVENTGDQYVFDISIKDQDPYFFANGILVHNTDSVYFSAWPFIKDDVESGKMEWNQDIAVALYDSISDQCNESWPAFMEKACHCPRELGAIIKGGREMVAEQGLFITKKRYAVLVVDDDGRNVKVDGKPGKLKAMGLDLKRSDTPVRVQQFLSDILMDALTNKSKEELIEKIIKFKTEFKALPPWEKGTPKRVNNLTHYGQLLKTKGRKANLPGHVRAAINYNNLREMNSDSRSLKIVDGSKTIVCKLKPNPMGFTSVAYPIDLTQIPDWFKELPFDSNLMEDTIVDQKINNLFGVLNWNLDEYTNTRTTFSTLFEWD